MKRWRHIAGFIAFLMWALLPWLTKQGAIHSPDPALRISACVFWAVFGLGAGLVMVRERNRD